MKIGIKWILILLFAINSILVGLQDVQALPTGYSHGTFNNVTTLIDTVISDTGLEWIDTRIFVGQTLAEVEASLNPSGIYEEFNLATQSEVLKLLADYGTEIGVGNSLTAGNRMLFDDLGSLFEGLARNQNEVINGRVTDEWTTGQRVVIQIAILPIAPSQGALFGFNDDQSGSTIGAWANRQTTVPPPTVPEPGLYIMVGLGFAALFVFQRKTRTNA